MTEFTPERQDFLNTIIITAVEGGINYWASVQAYEHTPVAWANVVPVADLEEDEDPLEYHLSPAKVEIAVNRILRAVVCSDAELPKYFPKHQAEALVIASMANDPCPDVSGAMDIDADFADSIVQVALFGEVVYG